MKELEEVENEPFGNDLLLSLCFGGKTLGSSALDSWLTVFVRMVDLASEEYRRAAYLWAIHGQGDLERGTVTFTIPKAGDRLELCILSLHRALRCFERISSSRLPIPIDRQIRREVDALTKEFVEIRGTIEHVDERIRGGLSEGEPHTLMIAADGNSASIAGQTINLVNFRSCLVKFRELAAMFVSFQVGKA